MTFQDNEATNNVHEGVRVETRMWLESLPRNVTPNALVTQFPRLANDIACLWHDAVTCGKFIDNLLFGTRNGVRAGFPYEVAYELSYLKVLTVYRTGEITTSDDSQQINIRANSH